ncbi:hypothetical protein D8674_038966 [Pyrus ussuriensis x Pyrus communis]|uniref:Uncharacterized protein n=1 Tax=Pyrus ussuriensis x Pyrus communis TaxID=2448454 RepID=A0A5N5GXC8_9ROSA|nr:hypothetical protein D8674_039017 [Pyrus ussuriensis x Pyrus communis]KAB2620269.1 hypothetical protein D8674_038966 [Pyrus ussuriensis x Pyrus communis]
MDSFTITITLTLTYEEVMPNDASPQYVAPSIVDIPKSSYAEEVDRPSDNDENVSLDDENNISHLEDDEQIQSLPQGETDCDDSIVPLDHRNRTTMVVGHHDYHASTSNPCHESIIAKKKRARAMGAAAAVAAVPDYGGGSDDCVVSSDHRNETTVAVAQSQHPDPGASTSRRPGHVSPREMKRRARAMK